MQIAVRNTFFAAIMFKWLDLFVHTFSLSTSFELKETQNIMLILIYTDGVNITCSTENYRNSRFRSFVFLLHLKQREIMKINK